MEKRIFREALWEAKRRLRPVRDPAHDARHARRVARMAAHIGSRVGYPDTGLLVLAGWWHDAGRPQGVEGHEERSAQMARGSILLSGGTHEDAERIYRAIRFHRWDMRPDTVEGKIVRDADKLDFLSVGRAVRSLGDPDRAYLRSIVPLLPGLRGMLSLEVSRKLFDRRIGRFRLLVRLLGPDRP